MAQGIGATPKIHIHLTGVYIVNLGSFGCAGVALVFAVGLVPQVADAQTSSGLKQQCPAYASWSQVSERQRHAATRAFKKLRPTDPALAKELSKRERQDQAARAAAVNGSGNAQKEQDASKKIAAVDKSNLTWIKHEVSVHGFPTVTQVGIAGVDSALVLVQHADEDPAFQAMVLHELKAQLKKEPFMRSSYAMLVDRVRTNEHKKQLYGTQFHLSTDRFGPLPIQDPANLAARREQAGLAPLSDYACLVRYMYHIPSKASKRHAPANATTAARH